MLGFKLSAFMLLANFSVWIFATVRQSTGNNRVTVFSSRRTSAFPKAGLDSQGKGRPAFAPFQLPKGAVLTAILERQSRALAPHWSWTAHPRGLSGWNNWCEPRSLI